MLQTNMYDYLIELLIKGKDVEEMSMILGLDKQYIIFLLGSLKCSIINNVDEKQYDVLRQIDKLMGLETLPLRSREKEILKMINYSDFEIMSLLNINYDMYVSDLKSIYYKIILYHHELDSALLGKIKEKIIHNDYHFFNGFINNEIENNEEDCMIRCKNGEIVTIDSPTKKILDLGQGDFKFILFSDTHLGSIYENMNYIEKGFDYASKKGIQYIIVTGDFIEGSYANYTRCKDEYKSAEAQIEHVLKDFYYDKNISIIVLLGNHDLSTYLTEGINIYPYLSERKDFIMLGYKCGYIKRNNNYIQLKHDVNRIVNKNEVEQIYLYLIGHSHQFRCINSNNSISLKAPATSDIVASSNDYMINKGFIVGEVYFDKNEVDTVSLEFNNFEEKNYKLVRSK